MKLKEMIKKVRSARQSTKQFFVGGILALLCALVVDRYKSNALIACIASLSTAASLFLMIHAVFVRTGAAMLAEFRRQEDSQD